MIDTSILDAKLKQNNTFYDTNNMLTLTRCCYLSENILEQIENCLTIEMK